MVMGRRRRAFIGLGIGAAAWACALAAPADKPLATRLSLGTAANAGCTADDVEVILSVEGADDFNTFSVELNFDPAKITFVAAVPGNAVSTAGWELTGANEAQPGRLLVAGAALSGVPLDGDAELFVLYFDCKPEACPSLAAITMQPIRGRSGAAELVGGSIACGAYPTLAVPPVKASCPDAEIVVPITAAHLPADTAALQFDLAYNPAELTFIRVENGASATAEGQLAEPGILRLSATPSQPDGELLRAVFTSAACPATTSLTLQNAQPPLADVLVFGGTVTLATAPSYK